ncbi:helix-turn-helix transcriptional regulator [Paenibacillus sp. N1-5-1-14]|uniref:helix-turn-helix transcriptional regulator n=1 Tax=Paenibacillus radicibacter TaxID=2972488 RepID=UPI002158E704|nr:helix-turn-helix transcriptional regulator [Paenibacillus radicibacter]MCR8644050.1 helix-turn-helix transcriptional regulator [Paenibacillus radicibacter]
MSIVKLVREQVPITGEQIAEQLGVSRPTIRSDLSLLVMLGYIDAKPKVGYFPVAMEDVKHEGRSHLSQLKVKDLQSLPVVVKETTTVNDAVVALFLENVGSLFVTDSEGMLLGVVSRKDLLKVTLGNPGAATMPISLAMTRSNLITVSPEEDLVEAARKIIHYEIDSLPVVTKHVSTGGKEKLEVIGRITKTTMTRILLEFVLG